MADSDTAHLFFAKKLASNDLEMRTNTLKTLSTFFNKGEVISETDFAKIWMGLWYSMWMSDKPKVQRELAESISKLLHSHTNLDNAVLFIKVFYTTMHREFAKIDRLRHDKFLKFARIFLHNSLLFIKNHNYDEDLIDKYIDAQRIKWERDDAQEIQLHVCDTFFVELYLACGNDVPSKVLFRYAAMFVELLKTTNHHVLKFRCFEALKAFILAAGYCSPKLAPKNNKGWDNIKELYPDIEFVNIDLSELEKWFMSCASGKGEFINRDKVYALHDMALKKQRAEPGFKLLPRGSIAKRMAEVEEQEYNRLMEEYEKSKEEEAPVKSKKEQRKEVKRKAAERKKAAQDARAAQDAGDARDAGDAQEDAEGGEGAQVEDITGAEEKVKGKKNKNKKRKVEATPPKTTVTTVKEVKKNAKGEVIGKKEETIETKVIDDGKAKVTEVTTTTKVEEVRKAPAKKGNKKQMEIEGEVPKEKEAAREVTTTTSVEEVKRTPVKKGDKKQAEEEKEEGAPAAKQTKAKAIPPTPASPTNGKKTNKRKSAEPETSPATPTAALNGKSTEKKRKVDSEGTPNGAAKKGKKEEAVEDAKEGETTPKGKGKKEGKVDSQDTPATPNGAAKKGKKEEAVEEAKEGETTPKGKGKKEGKKGKEAVVEEEVSTPKGKGQKGKKEEASAPAVEESDVTPKGKGKKGQKGKKEEVEVAGAVEEAKEGAKEGETTPKGKGKKGKKEGMKTPPAKSPAQEPPSTGKKNVRFSGQNHVKEFDKSHAVTTSPSTSSPASTPVKLKSLLTPSKKK